MRKGKEIRKMRRNEQNSKDGNTQNAINLFGKRQTANGWVDSSRMLICRLLISFTYAKMDVKVSRFARLQPKIYAIWSRNT